MTADDEAVTLHDVDPGDPFAWQLPELLAAALGVSTRTLRNRASKGSGVERLRVPGGRTYYRAARPDPAAEGVGSSGGVGTTEGRKEDAIAGELVKVNAALLAQLDAARDRLEAAHDAERLARSEATRNAVEAAELRTLAEVATRDAERLRADRQRATAAADALADDLARVRDRAELLERTAVELAAAPWYAFRRRRRARAVLEGEAGAAPSRPALPGPRLHRPATVG